MNEVTREKKHGQVTKFQTGEGDHLSSLSVVVWVRLMVKQ